MEEEIKTGARVAHSRFGNGKVLGFSEKKGRIRIRFERLGMKELAFPCKELGAPGGENETEGKKRIRVRFRPDTAGGHGCRWLLETEGGSFITLIRDIQTWANSKARLINGASIGLNAVHKRAMELRISGHGSDGRCRWCRTFRSGLRTAVRRVHGRRAFVLESACRFDMEKEKPP